MDLRFRGRPRELGVGNGDWELQPGGVDVHGVPEQKVRRARCSLDVLSISLSDEFRLMDIYVCSISLWGGRSLMCPRWASCSDSSGACPGTSRLVGV